MRAISLGLLWVVLLIVGATRAPAAEPLRVLANGVAPFYHLDERGNPAGFEHEMLTLIAKAQGRELEVRWFVKFGELMQALEKGEGDVAAATITATPERRAKFDFSQSYFPVRVQLVLPRDSPVRSLTDMRGLRAATIAGTTYEELLRELPDVALVHVVNTPAMVAAVLGGAADAFAVDSAVALGLLRDHPALRMGPPLTAEQEIAFALPKGSPLTAQLDALLGDLKSSGIYFRLLRAHFGEQAVEVMRSGRSPN
jgi:polar amino acid transport system substrate-binding protein